MLKFRNDCRTLHRVATQGNSASMGVHQNLRQTRFASVTLPYCIEYKLHRSLQVCKLCLQTAAHAYSYHEKKSSGALHRAFILWLTDLSVNLVMCMQQVNKDLIAKVFRLQTEVSRLRSDVNKLGGPRDTVDLRHKVLRIIHPVYCLWTPDAPLTTLR